MDTNQVSAYALEGEGQGGSTEWMKANLSRPKKNDMRTFSIRKTVIVHQGKIFDRITR